MNELYAVVVYRSYLYVYPDVYTNHLIKTLSTLLYIRITLLFLKSILYKCTIRGSIGYIRYSVGNYGMNRDKNWFVGV